MTANPNDELRGAAVAEGKGVSAAAPGTEAPSGGPFVSSGVDASKRRRLTPQSRVQGWYEDAMDTITKILTNKEVCANCFSPEHGTDTCPSDNGPDWLSMLITVHNGMEGRNQSLDTQIQGDPESSSSNQVKDVVMEEDNVEITGATTQQPESSSGAISFHKESRSSNEIVGEGEIWSEIAGGKDPTTIGFRKQEDLFDALHRHIIATGYIPRKGHVPRTDQDGMKKYSNWTREIVYGRAEPLEHDMAHFADPIWGLQRYNSAALQKGHGYNHARMRIFTQRWGTVLRHSIGQFGRAAFCDELGWVSIEEFIRNGHAWPIDGTSAWNYQTRDYRPEGLVPEETS